MLNVKSNILRPVLAGVCIACTAGVMLSATAADTLVVNQVMKRSQHLESANGEYRLEFQADGNVVIRRQSDQATTWSSKSKNPSANRLVLGPNGNLSVRDWGRSPVWESGTRNSRVNRMTLQNDGNLVMFDTANNPIWTSGVSTNAITPKIASNITHRGISRGNSPANTSTWSITRPSTTQVNDLMILVTVTATNNSKVSLTQSGWNLIRSCSVESNSSTACTTTDGTDDQSTAVFWRRASTAGEATYSLTRGTANNGYYIATLSVLGGANRSTTPISGSGARVTVADRSSFTCPSVTGVNAGMAFCIFVHDDPQPMTMGSGWTVRGNSP